MSYGAGPWPCGVTLPYSGLDGDPAGVIGDGTAAGSRGCIGLDMSGSRPHVFPAVASESVPRYPPAARLMTVQVMPQHNDDAAFEEERPGTGQEQVDRASGIIKAQPVGDQVQLSVVP